MKRAAGLAAGFLSIPSFRAPIQHVILIAPGGARKRDYYKNASLAPHIGQLASEGFVFEEDHCDTVTSHQTCLEEMVRGLPQCLYANEMSSVPPLMNQFKPPVLVLRDMQLDKGHVAYDEYLKAIRETDRTVGTIWSWVKSDPEFNGRTAIVFRPEFGRDDIVNRFGQLHHSPGFYYTHRVASIFWGPCIKSGVERELVVNRRDMAVRISSLLRPSLGA